MRALLDVNVLIALMDADHPHHRWAAQWFRDNVDLGWASCPLVQNGCVRIMSLPAYPNALPIAVVVERLREATANPSHAFWPDDLSALDPALFDVKRIHGARQLTDVYLLALAVRHGGRFVTFDGAIPRDAVRGASADNLLVLGENS
jgi:uncharacterized protein